MRFQLDDQFVHEEICELARDSVIDVDRVVQEWRTVSNLMNCKSSSIIFYVRVRSEKSKQRNNKLQNEMHELMYSYLKSFLLSKFLIRTEYTSCIPLRYALKTFYSVLFINICLIDLFCKNLVS